MNDFSDDYYEVQQLNKYLDRWYTISTSDYQVRFRESEAQTFYDDIRELGYTVRMVRIRRDVVRMATGVPTNE